MITDFLLPISDEQLLEYLCSQGFLRAYSRMIIKLIQEYDYMFSSKFFTGKFINRPSIGEYFQCITIYEKDRIYDVENHWIVAKFSQRDNFFYFSINTPNNLVVLPEKEIWDYKELKNVFHITLRDEIQKHKNLLNSSNKKSSSRILN